MKKLPTLIASVALFFGALQTASAEYVVIPGPPHERQFQFELLPGESEEATLIVKNLGNNDLSLDLYAADATSSNLGTFALTTKSTDQRHIGQWVTFEENMITVEGRNEVEIPFTVTVPPDATPGNYGGGIAVEALGSVLNPYTDGTETNDNISVSARIISKLFLNVPGDKIHDYQWTNFGFINEENNGKPRFTFEFQNDGNTIVLAEPIINISGFPPLPPEESTLTLPLITMQPGKTLADIDRKWDTIPNIGIYSATATIDFYELNITNQDKTDLEQQSRSIRINLTPAYIVVIIVGGIALIVLALLILVVSRRKFKKSLVPYSVKEGETIIQIAKTHSISWKKLAKVNHLKPPYELKTNQKILTPPKK